MILIGYEPDGLVQIIYFFFGQKLKQPWFKNGRR